MICRVEPEVFARFPQLFRGVVVAWGIDNSRTDSAATQLLREEEERARDAGIGPAHSRLSVWSQAYHELGAAPEKHASSIHRLARRIAQRTPVRSVSPVVDLFNAISLKHLLPVGGDCVDQITGDLTLGLARGSEAFSPLNRSKKAERPGEGEVIYVNRRSNRVLCRLWHCRGADFSRITRQTRCAVAYLDGLTSVVSAEEVIEATEALALLILRSCQGVVSTHYLDRGRPETEILKLAA